MQLEPFGSLYSNTDFKDITKYYLISPWVAWGVAELFYLAAVGKVTLTFWSHSDRTLWEPHKTCNQRDEMCLAVQTGQKEGVSYGSLTLGTDIPCPTSRKLYEHQLSI